MSHAEAARDREAEAAREREAERVREDEAQDEEEDEEGEEEGEEGEEEGEEDNDFGEFHPLTRHPHNCIVIYCKRHTVRSIPLLYVTCNEYQFHVVVTVSNFHCVIPTINGRHIQYLLCVVRLCVAHNKHGTYSSNYVPRTIAYCLRSQSWRFRIPR